MKDKIVSSAKTVLPIVCIVLIMSVSILPMPSANMLTFLVGAALLVVGMSLFDVGAEMSMQRLAQRSARA